MEQLIESEIKFHFHKNCKWLHYVVFNAFGICFALINLYMVNKPTHINCLYIGGIGIEWHKGSFIFILLFSIVFQIYFLLLRHFVYFYCLHFHNTLAAIDLHRQRLALKNNFGAAARVAIVKHVYFKNINLNCLRKSNHNHNLAFSGDKCQE